MTEDNAAEGTKQKADAESGKGGQRAHCRANLREKFAVKHQRGGDAVE